MNYPYYDYEFSPDGLRFEFDSISDRKTIRKIIQYTPLPMNPSIYNLGFGDLKENGTIDDLVVSNNNDMEMVLATIVQTMLTFFELMPEKTVIILGSTQSRTRLYQIVIAKFMAEAEPVLKIRGIWNGEIEAFVAHKQYDAFLINLKNT